MPVVDAVGCKQRHHGDSFVGVMVIGKILCEWRQAGGVAENIRQKDKNSRQELVSGGCDEKSADGRVGAISATN